MAAHKSEKSWFQPSAEMRGYRELKTHVAEQMIFLKADNIREAKMIRSCTLKTEQFEVE